MVEEKKYEYKVERIRKRKLTKIQKIAIFIAVVLFLILIIPRVFNSALTAKQEGLLVAGKNIKKYIEYNYMDCKHSLDENKEFDKDLFNDECLLKDNFSSKLIKNNNYKEEDIKEIQININTKKMRIIPNDNGIYNGASIIELDLHID